MAKNTGATVILSIVVVGFIAICILMLFRVVQESATLNIIFGALAAKFADAINYFTGSTASSKAKDQVIADIANKDSAK